MKLRVKADSGSRTIELDSSYKNEPFCARPHRFLNTSDKMVKGHYDAFQKYVQETFMQHTLRFLGPRATIPFCVSRVRAHDRGLKHV